MHNHFPTLLPALLLCATVAPVCADGSSPLSDTAVASLHALIKPQAGESRWMEIDWYPSVWEGRLVAAAQGKPILLMAGSGGAPCAGC